MILYFYFDIINSGNLFNSLTFWWGLKPSAIENAFSARSIALSTCCHQLSRAAPYEFTHNRVTRSLCHSIVGEAGFFLLSPYSFPSLYGENESPLCSCRLNQTLTPRDVSIRSQNWDLPSLDTLCLYSSRLACVRILLPLPSKAQVRSEQIC